MGGTPSRRPPGVNLDLTTELRWFFDGPLPSDMTEWFSDGQRGLGEHRVDRYRLDRRVDIGLKKRSCETLELKIRMLPAQPLSIDDDVVGNLETWRRWSPADGLIFVDHHTRWIDVEKTVVKRRFDCGGREQPLSEASRSMTGDACDAEIAALSCDGLDSWTFALAAFGQPDLHRQALIATWRALGEPTPFPERLALISGASCGYPQWIADVMKRQPHSPWQRRRAS